MLEYYVILVHDAFSVFKEIHPEKNWIDYTTTLSLTKDHESKAKISFENICTTFS